MNPQRTGSESDDSNPASSASPTPTVRDIRSEARDTVGPAPVHPGGQSHLPNIGMGRPEQRPPFVSSSTSPPMTSLHPSMAERTPERSPHRSQLRERDGLASPARLRPGSPSAARMGTENTPRVTESLRGIPRSAATATFSSPHTNTASSGGTSATRPRATRNHSTTAYPVSHPVNPAYSTYQTSQTGSMSRSASRTRPALKDLVIPPGIGRQREDEEDDEAEVVDRGADLIRKRQRERKQARKKKERERERRKAGEGVTPDVSAPPSGIPGDSFGAQQGRMPIGRSTSRSRLPSGVATDRTGSEGYFGSSWSSSVTPQGPMSPRDEFRPPSTYASTVDEDDDNESRQAESFVDEVVQNVVEAEAAQDHDEAEDEEEDEEDDDSGGNEDDEGVTLKDRQDAINIEHPFGLPIWKPALYRKSRTVTRNADSALHAIPSAAAERHLLPGNILWILFFGWWLAVACFLVALLVSAAEVLGGGRGGYGKTLRGLAWYIGWPFGKYVEGEGAPDDEEEEETEVAEYGATDASPIARHGYRPREPSEGASSGITVRETRRVVSEASTQQGLPDTPVAEQVSRPTRAPTISFAPTPTDVRHGETEPLIRKPGFRRPRNRRAKILGRIVYWPCFLFVVAPIMLFVCVVCWGLVFTIPMAKLTWLLLRLLFTRPLEINFRAAPKVPVPKSLNTPSGSPGSGDGSGDTTAIEDSSPNGFTMKRARLKAGQLAPTSGPRSTVLLCTYRAMGVQYLKYTVGGVNIIFVNLLPLILFVIVDDFYLLPAVEKMIDRGHPPSHLVQFITSQGLIFFLSLASVIPLSYFIGMAVASISAQSSIGMGAVINATFGSIIEIILYSIALMEGKGRLVEGSIVGSILAGVLLMPGLSMCSGALKRKEQKFNAKSAGVTSTMLIMATIGTLTPTMFYQIYGSFELRCEGCPDTPGGIKPNTAWKCGQCYYEHPDPVNDPFYQDQIKTLMYGCAAILLLSYLIGLWFSLRTHAAQIWQNPQQLMKAEEAAHGPMHPAHRASIAQRITPQAVMQHILPLHKNQARESTPPSRQQSMPTSPRTTTGRLTTLGGTPQRSQSQHRDGSVPEDGTSRGPPKTERFVSSGYTPFLDSVDRNIKDSPMGAMKLPSHLTTEDFTRAVAAATVSALRHQSSVISQAASGHKTRTANASSGNEEHEEEEAGGHESPNWTRGVSAGVLLGCTVLFAMIAEILVDVVDVVLEGVNVDEKFLGLTLFTLIPNTTEFMNAMSFAVHGNIALSMEIGSAYALQVCLLQIPAMVAFSAFYDPKRMGEDVDTFNLIFPQWDVIAIILSIFLLTYTYIEARSNYHRGSTLILSYLVLVMGFWFAPNRGQGDVDVMPDGVKPSFAQTLTRLWA